MVEVLGFVLLSLATVAGLVLAGSRQTLDLSSLTVEPWTAPRAQVAPMLM